MNQNSYSSGAVPQPNPSYPMAGMHSSAYAPPLNYNQPTEVVGGYDAQINPMTGQEIPQTNFAGGGLASILESKGRRGDTMLVHMNPEEVQGLQALAMAHGGSLTINPDTGLYEASFLKKLLPTIIGAVLPSVPGLNTFAKTVGFGNTALGTSLLVGGTTALIEGDLKKGLQAGLGAYSGANISESLRAASAAAPGKLAPEQLDELRRTTEAAKSRAELTGFGESSVSLAMPKGAPIGPDLQVHSLMNPSMTRSEVIPSYGSLSAPRSTSLAEISKYMPSVDVITGTGPVAPPAQTSIMGGIKGLFTSPESRTAFGQAMGGGFKSPFMQNIAKTVTYGGLANALTPDPKKLPTGGAGEDYIYIPGGFNPLYGTGRDQPYQLPGKYYKKTPQGLVPYNPFAMAPGYAEGGEIEGYADGGEVGVAPPRDPMFAQLGVDPNVAATRAYIEDLNRRARNPVVSAYPGTGGGFYGTPFDPSNFPSTPGGGGGGGGGESLTGSPAGDLIAGVGGQYLAQKGIEKGLGYVQENIGDLRDRLSADERAKIGNRPVEVTRVPAAGIAAVVPSLVPPAPAGTAVDVSNAVMEGDTAGEAKLKAEVDAARAPPTATIDPYAVTSAVSGLTSINPALGRVRSIGDEVVVNASRDAAWNAAYDKALDAAKESGLTGEAASEAAGKTADASTSGIGASLKNWAFKDPSAGFSGGIGNLKSGFTPPTTVMGTAAAALGAYNTAKSIEAGKEGRAAFDAFMTAAQFGGPITAIAAAAIAALGASMVTTKEFGDKALENYWKAVDSGRGIGQTPPEELAQGFINFYRTNKNEFPGQAKYGRTGNEDFVYDMTQVINKAVKDGTVDKGANAAAIYEKAVQPWLNTMGEGPKNKDARRVQDFMMTDLINSFMQGKPISNAQVKGDKKFKIVSERPVFAGTASASAPSSVNPFSEPRELAPVSTPYSPRIIEEEAAAMAPATAKIPAPAMTALSEPEREYIQPIMTPFSEIESEEPPRIRGGGDRRGAGTARFNYGGAVGDDYNFGFAGGGMPGEYAAGGKLLDGPGDGMSDDIPAVIRGKGVQRAALADGEFVIPADVVSHLGNGSTKAGAKKLYEMMARVRQARTGKTKQAPAVKTGRLLPV